MSTAAQPPSIPPRRPEPIRRSWIVPLSWLLVGLVVLLVAIMRLVRNAHPAAPTTTAPAPAPNSSY